MHKESYKNVVAEAPQAAGETFNITFDTNKLLKMFGFPSKDDLEVWDSFDFNNVPTDDEVGSTMSDYDIPDTPENRELVQQAMEDAMRWDAEAASIDALGEALDSCLREFSDYRYEYFSEQEFKTYSGTARGIITTEGGIGDQTTTLTVAADTVHIIMDCIAGYGMFDVSSELEGETPEEFIKTRFHWLNRYWEIYGVSKPEPDFDNLSIGNKYDRFLRDILKEQKLIK